MGNQGKFFRALGRRVRDLRRKAGYTQEDMISLGFSARHWQQIEAGRPITVTTLLRICQTFHVPMAKVVRGLDDRGAEISVGNEVDAVVSGRQSDLQPGPDQVTDQPVPAQQLDYLRFHRWAALTFSSLRQDRRVKGTS